MSICALIPAHNVQDQIASVVTMTLKYVDRVLVVNDGSSDETGPILEEMKAHLKHMDYVANPTNLGKAESVKRGLQLLFDKAPSPDFVVQLDADLAHSPEEIPGLLAASRGYDMVIGNRYHSRRLDQHRRAVVMLASIAARRLTGYELTDPLCGFRLYAKWLGEAFAKQLTAHGYGLETEQLIISRLLGARITQYNLVHVATQNTTTKAVEFIDVFQVLVNYADRIGLASEEKQQLAMVLSSLIQRDTFSSQLFGGTVLFKYFPETDSYALLAQDTQ